jgi:hypothetical protein
MAAHYRRGSRAEASREVTLKRAEQKGVSARDPGLKALGLYTSPRDRSGFFFMTPRFNAGYSAGRSRSEPFQRFVLAYVAWETVETVRPSRGTATEPRVKTRGHEKAAATASTCV